MQTLYNHIYSQLVIRFPVATLMIFGWACSLIIGLLYQPGGLTMIELSPFLVSLIKSSQLSFCLGIPLFVLISMIHRIYFPQYSRILFYLIGLTVLSFYFIDLLLFKSFVEETLLIKQNFFLLFIILILFNSFAPFLTFSMRNFWKFNNIVFIKIIKTLSYCFFILFIVNGGLFLLDYLFFSSIPFWLYQWCFIIIFCVFGSCFFLCQIPVNLQQFETDTPFPTFYYIFSNGYLLPFCLCSIVLFYILIGYFIFHAKDPLLELPVVFSVVMGVAIYLSIQYELLRSRTENIVIKKGLPMFYFSILPLCLFFSLQLLLQWKTTAIIEFWYILFLYFIWASLLCLYFIFSQRKDIRFIPISLSFFLICLYLPMFKPFNMSTQSHYKFVIEELRSNNLLDSKDTFILNDENNLSMKSRLKIMECLYFLEDHNQLTLFSSHYPYPILNQSLTLNRLFIDLDLDLTP